MLRRRTWLTVLLLTIWLGEVRAEEILAVLSYPRQSPTRVLDGGRCAPPGDGMVLDYYKDTLFLFSIHNF